MKAEELYRGIIDLDDKYIVEAQETKLSGKHPGWKRYAAIAACLCLIALSAVIVFQGKEQPAGVYYLSLFHDPVPGQEAVEICTLSYTDQSSDIEHFVTLKDGTTIPAVFLASSEQTESDDAGMTLEEAQSFAYMDLDTAPEELQEIILKAREVIIYSRAWVADGLEAYSISPDGTRSALPSFSELFPGWDLPTVDPDSCVMTADGLGRDVKYGMFAEATDIKNDNMTCRLTSTATPFQAGQSIRVYFPENFDAGGIEKGAVQFISYYGKDCDGAAGTVHADEISAYDGD